MFKSVYRTDHVSVSLFLHRLYIRRMCKYPCLFLFRYIRVCCFTESNYFANLRFLFRYRTYIAALLYLVISPFPLMKIDIGMSPCSGSSTSLFSISLTTCYFFLDWLKLPVPYGKIMDILFLSLRLLIYGIVKNIFSSMMPPPRVNPPYSKFVRLVL